MHDTPDSIHIGDEFSRPKKKILWYLKIMQQAELEELAKVMKISRMGTHKHLALLQKKGFVESVQLREGGVGRPKLLYQLTSHGKTVFPRSYAAIATCALDFIERNMGKEGVVKMLRERQDHLFSQYNQRLKALEFEGKVKELAKIRDEEGYIAESKRLNKKYQKNGAHILLEYNCPLIQVAEKHWEACSTETELFEKLLDAKIETTHTAAKGDIVCKFVIKPNKQGYI